MTDQMKTCRMCGEEIKAIAKRCPHCTHFQSRINAPIVIVIIGLAIVIATRFMMPSPLKRETLYNSDNKLTILETTHKYGKDDCGSFIAILGKLKNQTEKTWTDVHDVHFEVKFYNEKNELVDTLNSQLYSIVIGPKKETSFRIREKAAALEGQYKRHEITITKAQEDFKFF
jgi:hypothetical protein